MPSARVAGQIIVYFSLAFALLSAGAHATQISTHTISVDLRDATPAHIRAEINYTELTTSKVTYLVLARVGSVVARDGAGTISCTLAQQTYGTEISCVPNEASQKNYSATIDFDAYQIVSSSSMASLFSYNYGVSDPTDYLSVEILLPEATGIVKASEFNPIFPPGGYLGSTGRRTTVSWGIQKPDLGKTYTFNVAYEPISPGSSSFNINYGLVAIIAVLVALVIFFRFRSVSRVRTVLSVLKPDERKVVDALAQKDGACKQREIVKITDFSKAKVSRIISDLETRGLIEKERSGRTNKIKIAKPMDSKPAEPEKKDG